MDRPTLVFTYDFGAIPQRVFDVFTQPKHLDKWYTHNAKFDLQVGGSMSNGDGEEYSLLKVAVPRQLIFTYRHPKIEPDTEVDMTFDPSVGLNGTRLRIVHKGLDPKTVPAEASQWLTDRWTFMAVNLKRYLGRQGRLTFDQYLSIRNPVYEQRR